MKAKCHKCEYIILENSEIDKCIYDKGNGVLYELKRTPQLI